MNHILKNPLLNASGNMNVFFPSVNSTVMCLQDLSTLTIVPFPKDLCMTTAPLTILVKSTFADLIFVLFAHQILIL